jgi:hypothetical protein
VASFLVVTMVLVMVVRVLVMVLPALVLTKPVKTMGVQDNPVQKM